MTSRNISFGLNIAGSIERSVGQSTAELIGNLRHIQEESKRAQAEIGKTSKSIRDLPPESPRRREGYTRIGGLQQRIEQLKKEDETLRELADAPFRSGTGRDIRKEHTSSETVKRNNQIAEDIRQRRRDIVQQRYDVFYANKQRVADVEAHGREAARRGEERDKADRRSRISARNHDIASRVQQERANRIQDLKNRRSNLESSRSRTSEAGKRNQQIAADAVAKRAARVKEIQSERERQRSASQTSQATNKTSEANKKYTKESKKASDATDKFTRRGQYYVPTGRRFSTLIVHTGRELASLHPALGRSFTRLGRFGRAATFTGVAVAAMIGSIALAAGATAAVMTGLDKISMKMKEVRRISLASGADFDSTRKSYNSLLISLGDAGPAHEVTQNLAMMTRELDKFKLRLPSKLDFQGYAFAGINPRELLGLGPNELNEYLVDLYRRAGIRQRAAIRSLGGVGRSVAEQASIPAVERDRQARLRKAILLDKESVGGLIKLRRGYDSVKNSGMAFLKQFLVPFAPVITRIANAVASGFTSGAEFFQRNQQGIESGIRSVAGLMVLIGKGVSAIGGAESVLTLLKLTAWAVVQPFLAIKDLVNEVTAGINKLKKEWAELPFTDNTYTPIKKFNYSNYAYGNEPAIAGQNRGGGGATAELPIRTNNRRVSFNPVEIAKRDWESVTSVVNFFGSVGSPAEVVDAIKKNISDAKQSSTHGRDEEVGR